MSRGPAQSLGITLLLMHGIVHGLHSALLITSLSSIVTCSRHLTPNISGMHPAASTTHPYTLNAKPQHALRPSLAHIDVHSAVLFSDVSCPLQLAASDAAVHGWPLTTLLPLLDTLASGHSQELVPLLCRPLVQALQHQQQGVVGAMLRVLREDAELDKADQLWEALLLLAYQV